MEDLEVSQALTALQVFDIKQAARKRKKFSQTLHKLMKLLFGAIKYLGIAALVYCILNVVYKPELLTFETIVVMFQLVILAHFLSALTGYYSKGLKGNQPHQGDNQTVINNPNNQTMMEVGVDE